MDNITNKISKLPTKYNFYKWKVVLDSGGGTLFLTDTWSDDHFKDTVESYKFNSGEELERIIDKILNENQ